MPATTSSNWEDIKPQAYKVLRHTFGFESFRGVQEDAVRAVLSGRDCLVLMPTGGGKSLCYALPAVVKGGLVVVVSPLIALMQDQVAALQSLGIAADYLSSTRSTAERTSIFAKLSAAADGAGSTAQKLALLYVTPELLATDNFRQRLTTLHRAGALQFLAVDEAHCISSWGHDFRPTYRQLAALRSQLPGLPCMALTATATAQVQQDIVLQLRLQKPVKLITSFNRPNIHYSVVLLDVQKAAPLACNSTSSTSGAHRPTVPAGQTSTTVAATNSSKAKHRAPSPGLATNSRLQTAAGDAGLLQHWGVAGADDESGDLDVDLAGYEHLLQLLSSPTAAANKEQLDPKQRSSKTWKGPVAIAYALKRSTVDTLVRRLSGAGFAVAGYHAALPDAVREGVLQRWRAGELQVVVATVAFGMGVDKGDIELVVHFNLPRTVEAFYQESGRAGRNGAPASSVLFYSTRDRRRMDWILQKDGEKKEARKRKKAAGKATAGQASQQVQEPTAAASNGNHDPAAAAAALKAFGAVVELCTQPGCRRARLLKHFGEESNSKSQQQQGSRGTESSEPGRAVASQRRCCDYCDDAGRVSSYAQQLKDKEVELLQRHTRRASYTNKRQRGAGGDLFGGLWGGEGSDDEDGGSKSSFDDSDVELDYETAAASAAVARATAAAKRAAVQKAGGAADTAGHTDAFLSAMMKAEQRHQQKHTGEAAADGDALSRLMAAKDKEAPGDSAAITDDVRAARRRKLAEVILSNKQLQGCPADAAADVAAALEETIHRPGMTAAQHSAALRQMVPAVKSATGWLQLPSVDKLQGKGLSMVLKLAVDAVVKLAQPLHKSSTPIAGEATQLEAALLALAKVPVTASVLEESAVANKVKSMRKHREPKVAAAASQVIISWRSAVS